MTATTTSLEYDQMKDYITSPPVVYLCAEYAVDSKLPIYAGGLGVLAGDVLWQASEEKKSFLGVGLYYHHGYLYQEITKTANIYKEDTVDLAKADLHLLVIKGKPVQITVPIQDRSVKVQVWVKMVGSVPLLLLDTDVPENESQDINICDRLYYGDKEHRLKQEMILGIGGARLIQELGIIPRLYHLNEGHSALMLYELVRSECKKNGQSNVEEALSHIKNVVFTNHTLVPAGNDVFSKDLVTTYLSSFASEFPIDPHELIKFGLIQDSSLFSPTLLALRLATVSQAVSVLHAKKALEIWADHPMVPVTNGVRQSYWQSSVMSNAEKTSDASLWMAHLDCKRKLRSFVQDSTGFAWSENDLFIGWARRLANYKRPLLLFEDMVALERLITQSSVPVRIVISGKPHAHDDQALNNLRLILEKVGSFNGSIVYIQNYNLDVAKILLSGVDVLLNTPVRGFEACGTSGMKASLNGVLSLTTLDGWTDEVDWTDMGWVLPENEVREQLFELMNKEIIPLYLQKNEQGIPSTWIARMRKTITMAQDHYTAHRMHDELEKNVYSQIK